MAFRGLASGPEGMRSATTKGQAMAGAEESGSHCSYCSGWRASWAFPPPSQSGHLVEVASMFSQVLQPLVPHGHPCGEDKLFPSYPQTSRRPTPPGPEGSGGWSTGLNGEALQHFAVPSTHLVLRAAAMRESGRPRAKPAFAFSRRGAWAPCAFG